MKKSTLRLITIAVCFCIDSTLTYYLPYNFMKNSIIITPKVGLMMFVLLNSQVKAKDSFLFALFCGFYYSLIYADSLLIYVLIYSIVAYFSRIYIKESSHMFIETYVFTISTIFFQEIVIYFLMIITYTTRLGVVQFMTLRLLPTLLFNSILFVGVYYFHKKFKYMFEEK